MRCVVATLIVGDEGLGAVLLPLHWPRKPAAGPDHERMLRIDESLHAEAAADIGRDQAEHVLRHFEHRLGERVAHEMRTLRCGVERGAPAVRIVVGNGVARLHRIGHDAIVDQFESHDMRGLGEGSIGCLGVAHVIVPIKHDVAGNVFKQLRRARSNRILGRGDRRQRLIFDLNGLGGIAGCRQVFGNHQCHRLTDVTHLADCQHRPRRVMPRRAVTIDEWSDAGNVAEPIGANVVAGRYQQHARHVSRGDRIDALDLRMRQRRTQHSGMRHSRQSDVVGIAAASRNETQVLMAPYWLPDAKFHGCPHRYRVNGKPDLCSVNQSTSNTTWAALPSIRAPLHRQCPVAPKGDDHG